MRACGSENQLFHFFGIIESQELRYPSAHRVTDNDCIVRLEMIHQRNQVLAKHLGSVVDGRFAGAARATIIVDNHPVILGEFRYLIDLPDLAIAGGFAKKNHWRSFAMNLVIYFDVFRLQRRHEDPPPWYIPMHSLLVDP